MRRECRERFPRHQLQRKPLVSDSGMYHGTCVTHVPWYMIAKPRWRGKRSRHSRRMCNPQFYVSGKRPIVGTYASVNNGSGKSWFPDATKSSIHRCWLIITEVLWHSPDGSYTGNTQDIIQRPPVTHQDINVRLPEQFLHSFFVSPQGGVRQGSHTHLVRAIQLGSCTQ